MKKHPAEKAVCLFGNLPDEYKNIILSAASQGIFYKIISVNNWLGLSSKTIEECELTIKNHFDNALAANDIDISNINQAYMISEHDCAFSIFCELNSIEFGWIEHVVNYFSSARVENVKNAYSEHGKYIDTAEKYNVINGCSQRCTRINMPQTQTCDGEGKRDCFDLYTEINTLIDSEKKLLLSIFSPPQISIDRPFKMFYGQNANPAQSQNLAQYVADYLDYFSNCTLETVICQSPDSKLDFSEYNDRVLATIPRYFPADLLSLISGFSDNIESLYTISDYTEYWFNKKIPGCRLAFSHNFFQYLPSLFLATSLLYEKGDKIPNFYYGFDASAMRVFHTGCIRGSFIPFSENVATIGKNLSLICSDELMKSESEQNRVWNLFRTGHEEMVYALLLGLEGKYQIPNDLVRYAYPFRIVFTPTRKDSSPKEEHFIVLVKSIDLAKKMLKRKTSRILPLNSQIISIGIHSGYYVNEWRNRSAQL